ncbi:hypothetical protein FZ983_13400 [Azospirillum sp. B21]|uniref:hypothetical protein n=1 Tax=Azospirillum sp. B21 TaxID=2607496 RepID=UPI0011EDDE7C|nr:hypothetical protein [Azospirillum sp. B21]KAA0580561.1 hypothetical protein FZ983_13400 [Azospirillum sp. B21]
MDDRHDDRPDTRPESPPIQSGAEPINAQITAAAPVGPTPVGPDPVLERLDRLSDLLLRRIDRLEERVRSLEQDNGEIINLLIAVKAGLEEASGDLIAQLEEAEDAAEGDEGNEDGAEDGPLFETPCGPTMLH